jgi:hypothetical protein
MKVVGRVVLGHVVEGVDMGVVVCVERVVVGVGVVS